MCHVVVTERKSSSNKRSYFDRLHADVRGDNSPKKHFVHITKFVPSKIFLLCKGQGKGKVHPRTGHEGPEGEQRYSYTPSLTSALDGGGYFSFV